MHGVLLVLHQQTDNIAERCIQSTIKSMDRTKEPGAAQLFGHVAGITVDGKKDLFRMSVAEALVDQQNHDEATARTDLQRSTRAMSRLGVYLVINGDVEPYVGCVIV